MTPDPREWIRRAERWAMNDFLAPSESESDRDGYLSHRAEFHAAAWGLAVGALVTLTGQLALLAGTLGWLFSRGGDRKVPEYIPYPDQFRRESAYLVGHLFGGVVVGLVLRAVLQALGVGVPPLDPAALVETLPW